MQALRAGKITHAYLFSGPRGCGKTTSARILARCLNCATGPTPTPCGQCESCRELGRGGPGSLDVVEIDAASHNGVDDARDLRERAAYAPARDRFKIFILDEAHMVTPQGFNALLKLVEEPPPHVKFIFATTEPDKVIGTIRSRTHHYPFRLVAPDTLTPYLEELCVSEGVPVGSGVLPLVVRAGGGSVRDSLSVLDQLIAGSDAAGLDYERAVALLGYTHAALLDDTVDAIAARDGASAFRVVDRVISSGHEPRRFVEDVLERLAGPHRHRGLRRGGPGRPARPPGGPARADARAGQDPRPGRALARRRPHERRAQRDDGGDLAEAAPRAAGRAAAAPGGRRLGCGRAAGACGALRRRRARCGPRGASGGRPRPGCRPGHGGTFAGRPCTQGAAGARGATDSRSGSRGPGRTRPGGIRPRAHVRRRCTRAGQGRRTRAGPHPRPPRTSHPRRPRTPDPRRPRTSRPRPHLPQRRPGRPPPRPPRLPPQPPTPRPRARWSAAAGRRCWRRCAGSVARRGSWSARTPRSRPSRPRWSASRSRPRSWRRPSAAAPMASTSARRCATPSGSTPGSRPCSPPRAQSPPQGQPPAPRGRTAPSPGERPPRRPRPRPHGMRRSPPPRRHGPSRGTDAPASGRAGRPAAVPADPAPRPGPGRVRRRLGRHPGRRGTRSRGGGRSR